MGVAICFTSTSSEDWVQIKPYLTCGITEIRHLTLITCFGNLRNMSGSFLMSENGNFSEFPKSTYVTFTVSSLLTAVKKQQSGTYLKTNTFWTNNSIPIVDRILPALVNCYQWGIFSLASNNGHILAHRYSNLFFGNLAKIILKQSYTALQTPHCYRYPNDMDSS